jgi:SLA1 homology domain 1, SHD1
MSSSFVFRPGPAGLVLAVFACLACVNVPALAVSPQDSPVEVSGSIARTWTSSDGAHRMEGTLVAIEGETIRLHTPDGKNIAAPLAKLSVGDQAFVRQELARVASAASPFMEEGTASPFSEESGTFSAATTPEPVDPDMSGIELVPMESDQPLDLAAEHWKPAPPAKSKGFRFPIGSIHTRVARSFASPAGDLFVASLHDPFGTDHFGPMQTETGDHARPNDDKCKSWIELVGLPDGKSLGRYPLAGERTVAGDIDADGKTLLAFDGTFAQNPRLYLYDLTAEGLRPRTWWIAKDSQSGNDAVASARLLADGNVVSHIRNELIVWKTSPVKPLYSFSNSDANWRLASDRRHALVEHSGRKFEVDLIGGQCTGVLGGEASDIGGVPSPDSSRLAALKDGVVTLRDASGNVRDEFYAPVFWPSPTISWHDDRTLRVDSPHQTHFVDLDNRVVLLEVTNTGAQESGDGWTVDKQQDRGRWYITVRQATQTSSQLPDLDKCRNNLPPTPESLLVLNDGDRVAIQLELESDPSLGGAAEKAIRKLLKTRGVEVDDDAEDVLRLRSSAREEQVEYRGFGVPPWRDGGAETVNVRTVTSAIELVRDGKVIWSRSSATGPGFMLHMQEGETAQQAADRQAGNPADFWKNLALPRHVAAHPNGGAWCKVIKTANGYEVIE